MAAIFTGIAYRESRYRPYSANDDGYFGILQWGSRGSDGKKKLSLAYPFEERVVVWKLAYTPWQTEGLTEQTIDAKLKDVQKNDPTKNAGKAYYDERVWIPLNQVRLFRSKLARNDLTKSITVMGTSAGTAPTFPYGELFLTHSWIAGVPFAVVSNTYTKMTGKTEDDLKQWIRTNVPKDSKVRNIDPENNISKLENWINNTIPENSLSKKNKEYNIYKIVYIK